MKVSLDWLAEFVDFSSLGKTSLEQASSLSDLLTQRGLEVEKISDLTQGLESVEVVSILELNPHPNADRLQVCLVETGACLLYTSPSPRD